MVNNASEPNVTQGLAVWEAQLRLWMALFVQGALPA